MSSTVNPDPIAHGSFTFHRMLLGIGSSGMSQVISAAQAILLVPLFLYAWGAEGYGRWLVLTALVSYLTLLDFGGQNYIGNLLAIDYAQNKKEAFCEKLSEGVSLFILISLFVFCLLIILLFGLMNSSLPVFGRTLLLNERWIILFLSSAFLLSIPSGIYVTAYRASGLFVRGTMLGNILRLINIALYAMALFIAVSPVIYSMVFFFVAVLSTIVVVWDSRRVISECSQIQVGFVEAKKGLKHLRGALEFWLLALGTGLNQQGVLLVLAIFASPATVALYVTHRTAAGVVGYVGSLVQAPLWPEMSFLWAQCRYEKLQKVLLTAIKIVMLVSGLAALAMWVLLPFVYPLWTGKQLQLSPSLFAIFLLQGVLAAGWATSSWGLLATNHHKMPARWSFGNATVTIVLSFLLAPKYGVFGVALATLLGDVLCGLAVYPKLTGDALGLNVLCIYKTMMIDVLMLAPLLVIVAVGGYFLQGWTFVASFMVATAVWVVLVFSVVAKQERWHQLLPPQLFGRFYASGS